MAGGRPPKKPDELKSAPISFRITETLRENLEKARHEEAPSRTLSQEIEARLLRSFGETQRMDDSLGGRTLASLFLVAAARINAAELSTGKRWYEDPYTHAIASEIVNGLLANRRPKGRVRSPKNRIIGQGPGGAVWLHDRLLDGQTHLRIAEAALAAAYAEDVPARPEFKSIANALVPKKTKRG